MANPYVFLVGCPRSGTTLLQRIVDAHPRIAIIPESHWIARYFKARRGLTPEGLVTPGLISNLLEHPEFGNLHIGENELERLTGNNQPLHYSDFVRSIFDVYGKARGKSLVGNKTPGFVRKIRLLHSLWPAARFVHLIRDGRDVYLSMLHRPLKRPKPGAFDSWKEDPITTGALWWEMSVRSGQEAGRALGPELYCEVRYESLVDSPAEECAALCGFLGLPYDDVILRFHEGQAGAKAARPVTRGLRDWRSQMPAEDQERFAAAAGTLLDELGYPRAYPDPQAERLEVASKARDLFARDIQTRDGSERSPSRADER